MSVERFGMSEEDFKFLYNIYHILSFENKWKHSIDTTCEAMLDENLF